jgi:hypothetical protein
MRSIQSTAVRSRVVFATMSIVIFGACSGKEADVPENARDGGGGGTGNSSGTTSGGAAGGRAGSATGPGTVGTSSTTSTTSTTTSMDTVGVGSSTTGGIPCRDGGGGGQGGGGADRCSRPVCNGDASACPQPNAFCDDRGLCCALGVLEGAVCLECTCDAECGNRFCVNGFCNGCRTDCDCPGGQRCLQATFSDPITFDCRARP